MTRLPPGHIPPGVIDVPDEPEPMDPVGDAIRFLEDRGLGDPEAQELRARLALHKAGWRELKEDAETVYIEPMDGDGPCTSSSSGRKATPTVRTRQTPTCGVCFSMRPMVRRTVGHASPTLPFGYALKAS